MFLLLKEYYLKQVQSLEYHNRNQYNGQDISLDVELIICFNSLGSLMNYLLELNKLLIPHEIGLEKEVPTTFFYFIIRS